MKRFRLIGVALVAVLALGAMVASSAQAISPAPFFSIGGTRLAAGQTHNVTGRVFKTNVFVLHTPELGVEIECKAFTVEKGVLLGSAEGSPGRDNEIVKFSGCALIAGNGFPECELANEASEPTTTLKTNQLISELVENVSGGGGGKQLYEEFFGVTANFITLHFRGAKCIIPEAAVSGQVVAENLTDNAAEEKIELGQTAKEATSWLLKFPTTSIKEVWLISGGVGKIVKTKLTVDGDTSTQTGVALVLLANSNFVPEFVNWSPLP
jgi:hypothetical protein